MIVRRIVARPPFRRGKCRKFTREPQQFLVQALGVHTAGALEMSQHGNGTVQHLQDQIVDALQPTAG